MDFKRICRRISSSAKFCYGVLVAALVFLLSAWLWFLLFCFGGAFLLIAGVRYVAGDGYANVAAGLLCFAAAALIRRALNG